MNQSSGFWYSCEPLNGNKKKSEKIDQYLDLAKELKKTIEFEDTVMSIVVGALGKFSKDLENRLGRLEIRERMENKIHNV